MQDEKWLTRPLDPQCTTWRVPYELLRKEIEAHYGPITGEPNWETVACDLRTSGRRDCHELPPMEHESIYQALNAIRRGRVMLRVGDRWNTNSAEIVSYDSIEDAQHSADFTSASWFGRGYTFAKGHQAESVRALWAEWEKTKGKPPMSLSEKSIAEKLESAADNFRLAHVFRDHPAWDAMIRRSGPGTYFLANPG